MPDDHFQVSQRLTSDPTTTPRECNKGDRQHCPVELINDQRDMSVSWLQRCKMTSLERKEKDLTKSQKLRATMAKLATTLLDVMSVQHLCRDMTIFSVSFQNIDWNTLRKVTKGIDNTAQSS